MSNKKNILLIGAGPIGLEVASALTLSGIDYKHVEAGCLASTIDWWSPGTSIFSSPDRLAIASQPFMVYPAVKASKEDYLNYLRSVVRKYNLKIDFYKRVIAVKKKDSKFSVTIADSRHGVGGPMEYLESSCEEKKEYLTNEVKQYSKIILAIGDMHLPKQIGIPGEKQPNVSHYFEDPHKYFGTTVCIVGAKNSAAEAVVRLGRIAAKVIWCCRKIDFNNTKIKPWLLPDIKALIKEGLVELHTDVEPEKIEDNRIYLRNLINRHKLSLQADSFLLMTGYRQNPDLYNQLGIRLIGESKRPKYNPQTMETNIKGVYVAGTCVAGTQLGGAKVFIENCHDHSIKIARAIGSKARLFDIREQRKESEREQ